MLRLFRRKGAKRLVMALLAVTLVITGITALAAGRPAYRNYKGQWVFPPVAIVLGLGGLVYSLRSPRPQPKRRKRPGTR
jgi:hypothetical protein